MAKSVLYIDSDPVWMEQVVGSFAAIEQPLLTATNAADALVQAEIGDISLFLVGLKLENESCRTLVRFLRANHPSVPVVIVGGSADGDEEVQALLRQGAAGQLEKGGMDEFLVGVGAYLSS